MVILGVPLHQPAGDVINHVVVGPHRVARRVEVHTVPAVLEAGDVRQDIVMQIDALPV